MLRHILTLASLAGAVTAAAANSLVWLDTKHDFGAFHEDLGKVRCEYLAVNVDSVPVSILSARANCGCTVPTYPKEAIDPGDTLRITVEYDAIGRPGRFLKKVFIDSSDGQKQTLEVRGTVVAGQNTLSNRFPVAVGSVRLNKKTIPFGSTVKGRILTGGLNIYNSTDHPIQPRIVGLPDYMKGYVNPPVIPVGEAGFLNLTASSGHAQGWGTVADSFLLIPDRDHPADSVRINTAMILNEDFSQLTPAELAAAPSPRLSTEVVDFGTISGTEPLMQTFTISNLGESPLLVRSVSTAEEALTVSLSTEKIGYRKKATVLVTLDPSKLPADAPLNARINFIFNAPGADHATVRVVGLH